MATAPAPPTPVQASSARTGTVWAVVAEAQEASEVERRLNPPLTPEVCGPSVRRGPRPYDGSVAQKAASGRRAEL
jgi:hypothetical protein